MKHFLIFLISLLFVSAIHSQNMTGSAGKIISPNGKINISIDAKNTSNDGYGQVYFTVEYVKNKRAKYTCFG